MRDSADARRLHCARRWSFVQVAFRNIVPARPLFARRATLGVVAELLIVDDDPAIRRMLERTLAAEQYAGRVVAGRLG